MSTATNALSDTAVRKVEARRLAARAAQAQTCQLFKVTVPFARDAADAIDRVAGRLPAGFQVTGQADTLSARHMLMDVQVQAGAHVTPAQVDDCWVALTSYGMTPTADMGASWQQVPGVGRYPVPSVPPSIVDAEDTDNPHPTRTTGDDEVTYADEYADESEWL